MFSASLRFTPAGLARKNAPGVFVVIVRERRATSDAEWRLYRRNLGGPTQRAGAIFRPCCVVSRLCGMTTLHSLRLAWPKNSLRQADERNGNRP